LLVELNMAPHVVAFRSSPGKRTRKIIKACREFNLSQSKSKPTGTKHPETISKRAFPAHSRPENLFVVGRVCIVGEGVLALLALGTAFFIPPNSPATIWSLELIAAAFLLLSIVRRWADRMIDLGAR